MRRGARADGNAPADITVPAGFSAERIATVAGARELAVAPNGDLFAGTTGDAIDVIPDAEGTPGAPQRFATVSARPVAGVAFGDGSLCVSEAAGAIYRIRPVAR